jgi:hypothetical protein
MSINLFILLQLERFDTAIRGHIFCVVHDHHPESLYNPASVVSESRKTQKILSTLVQFLCVDE